MYRHRGLPYRDKPTDRYEQHGVLAQPVELSGITLPEGTPVGRDCDFDYVYARLAEPMRVGRHELPVGTYLHFYRHKPRALWEWPLLAVLWALVIPFVLLIALAEIAQGRWPTRCPSPKGEPRPGTLWLCARTVLAILPRSNEPDD